jgi:hypothetical protein
MSQKTITREVPRRGNGLNELTDDVFLIEPCSKSCPCLWSRTENLRLTRLADCGRSIGVGIVKVQQGTLVAQLLHKSLAHWVGG